eukprot:scaffold86126_cov32-Tisochrysis_lutea.AAC.3
MGVVVISGKARQRHGARGHSTQRHGSSLRLAKRHKMAQRHGASGHSTFDTAARERTPSGTKWASKWVE